MSRTAGPDRLILSTSPEVVHFDGQNHILWIELEADSGERVMQKFSGVAAFRCEPAARKVKERALALETGSTAWLEIVRGASRSRKTLHEFVLTGADFDWHIVAVECARTEKKES